MGTARHRAVVRHAIAFLACLAATYAIAAISQSLLIMAALERAGAAFDLATRLRVIGHDLIGLTFYSVVKVSYGISLFIGFAIALPIAALLVKHRARAPRALIFAVAGAAVVALILLIIQLNFYYNMTLLEGTRGPLGYALQLIAGASGGLTYAAGTRAARAP
jgi:hypothetical protein